MSPDNKIKDEAAKFYSDRSPDDLPMEGLALLLFVLADADKKLKRNPLADEIARYLVYVHFLWSSFMWFINFYFFIFLLFLPSFFLFTTTTGHIRR